MYDGGYRERFHLIDMLAAQKLSKDLFELIWVEHFDTIHEDLKSNPGVKIVTLNRRPPLFVSYCWNEGIRKSNGDILVMIDADVVVPSNFLETVLREHKRNSRLVMYFFRPEEPGPDPVPDQLPPVNIDFLKKVCILNNPNNYGGCLTVRKKWMMQVNGYEQFPCFAGNVFTGGKELYTRFKNLGLEIKWYPSMMLYHPWHPKSYGPFDHHPVKGTFHAQAQREVIQRRERSLGALPYQGIDPIHNSEPDWWDEWVVEWKKQQQKASRHEKLFIMYEKFCQLFKSLFK